MLFLGQIADSLGQQKGRDALPKSIQHRQTAAKPTASADNVKERRHDDALGFENPSNSEENLIEDQADEIAFLGKILSGPIVQLWLGARVRILLVHRRIVGAIDFHAKL